MVQKLCAKAHGAPAPAKGASRARSSEQAFGTRRNVQPNIAAAPWRRRSLGAATDATLAIARISAAADRRSIGEVRVRGRLCHREGVRGAFLHAGVCRSYPETGETMVQHG